MNFKIKELNTVMNIFTRLYLLKLRSSNNPKEDYLTEIFAYVIDRYPDILLGFLNEFKVTNSKPNLISIRTQESYKKLENHETDSKPDISIYLKKHVIFIENKIDSFEGVNQLRRYAEQLDRISEKSTLIYITRDYDKKEKSKIIKNCTNKINFIQIRWYEIFYFLRKFRHKRTIKELLKFMNNMDLASNNQFSPIDILALTNFSRVKKMMDETMYVEVDEKFKQILGYISQNASSLTQIKYHDRYVYQAKKKGRITFMLGYWLNSRNEKEYPDVALFIEVNPNSNERNKIIGKLNSICEKNKFWSNYGLDDSSWAGLYKSKSLKDFLMYEDQVSEIKKFFLNSLNELNKILPAITID